MKEANPNIDLSEMEQGILLKRNSIGKYVSPEIEGLALEKITGRVLGGKCVYVLWGDEEKNPEHKAKHFFETDSKEKAEELFSQLCVSDNLAEEGYTFGDVNERYHLIIMDEKTCAPYLMDLSASSKKNFLNYAKGINYGLVGNTNKKLSSVITEVSAGEMKRGTYAWTAEFFKFIADVD